jgi:hypothetical protein
LRGSKAITVTWWKKQGDEFRASLRERNQSKIGRMARLRSEVEIANALAAASAPCSPPWHDPAPDPECAPRTGVA